MKMRASHVLAKHKIVCEQVDVLPPKQDEVLVKTAWAAICGSDVHVVHSELPLQPRVANPGTPGHEGIGYIEESRLPDFKKGELVLTIPGRLNRTGTFADYQTIQPRYLVKVPPTDVPLEQLLMAQQFGTTIFSLRHVPVDVVGKTVMVLGQGSAGVFFAWSLKNAGAATVIASDKSEARLAISRHFGVDVPVKAGQDAYQAVMDHTDGKGVDYLVEAVGNREALAQSIGLIREGGNGLYFGQPDTQELVPFNFHDFQRRRLTINATTDTLREPNLLSFKRALDLIVRKKIDVAPLISHVFPLDQIETAMDHATTYRDNARKVCFKF
ncbi:MAG: zinc-binding dehydrogenase [Candidatus Lambdaproteobacteria bacterium]|nr:zinc-binding dehydrogenase [Candidatus Lambdaproteobacteria bacterium]